MDAMGGMGGMAIGWNALSWEGGIGKHWVEGIRGTHFLPPLRRPVIQICYNLEQLPLLQHCIRNPFPTLNRVSKAEHLKQSI